MQEVVWTYTEIKCLTWTHVCCCNLCTSFFEESLHRHDGTRYICQESVSTLLFSFLNRWHRKVVYDIGFFNRWHCKVVYDIPDHDGAMLVNMGEDCCIPGFPNLSEDKAPPHLSEGKAPHFVMLASESMICLWSCNEGWANCRPCWEPPEYYQRDLTARLRRS